MKTPDFDALAPHYRWIEAVTFGPLLQWCRTAMLPQVRQCRRALVLGDGNGRFLAALLATNPDVTIDALDISPAMIALARQRVEQTSRVRFQVADACNTEFPAVRYDLIVTNFILDCLTARDLRGLIPRLAASLEPGGDWIVGDFRVPARGWPRIAAQVALASMYAFFHFATKMPARRLVDPAPLLRAHGLTLDHEESRLRGFLSAQLWRKRHNSEIPGSIHPARGNDG